MVLNVQHDPQWAWSFTKDTAPRSLQSREAGGVRPLLRPSARYWLPPSPCTWVAEQFWLALRALPKPRRVDLNSSLFRVRTGWVGTSKQGGLSRRFFGVREPAGQSGDIYSRRTGT